MSKIIVGNWKMNPSTLEEAKNIISKTFEVKSKNVSVVIAPPAVFLIPLMQFFKRKKILFGAQNTNYLKEGAHTGEISVSMLRKAGVQYVIAGHSERRAQGESDADVSLKVASILKEKMIPILCIGEKEHDSAGAYLEILQNQLLNSLSGVPTSSFKSIIIAYEPIWAIGKEEKDAMNSRMLHETSIFIRKILNDKFGKLAKGVKIIYGGAVSEDNAYDLVHDGEVDGLLVGHHSLKPTDFKKIIMEVGK